LNTSSRRWWTIPTICASAEIEGERTIVFELRCHPDDVGKVIGKSGKTVGAIRVLLSTVAARQNRRAMLEVVE
jgi:uncharacterized protein